VGKYFAAALMIVGGLLLLLAPMLPQDGFLAVDAEGAWVLIIEDTSDRSPTVVRLQADKEYWSGLEARKLKHRFYDVESPDAESYKKPAKDAGIPAVVVASSDGKVLAAKPLPATTEGLDSIVKGATGR
jgi:hypothetical protein